MILHGNSINRVEDRVAFNENILVIEFIGRNESSAPKLINIKPNNPQMIYNNIFSEMNKLVKSGLIHGDLSAYNILISDKPYLIDFSQAVPLKHQLAKEFLERDIRNINNYFKKLGVKLKTGDNMLKRVERE